MDTATIIEHLDAEISRLQQAKAVLVPSVWWEPLGLVVYESYDFSRPVLAAASGGLPEIVIQGGTGLLHEPGNAEQLARHVMEVEEEPKRSRSMGKQGRLWLEQNANETQWRESFADLVARALNATG